jgi:hypothetical protein
MTRTTRSVNLTGSTTLILVLLLLVGTQSALALDPGRIRFIDSDHAFTAPPNAATSLSLSFTIAACDGGDYRYLVAPIMWHNPIRTGDTNNTPAIGGEMVVTWDCDGAGTTCSPLTLDILTSDCTNDSVPKCVGMWGIGINEVEVPSQSPDPHDTDEPPHIGSGVLTVNMPVSVPADSDVDEHELVLGAVSLCGVALGQSTSDEALISANVGKNNTTVNRGLIQVDTADGAMAIDLLAVNSDIAHTAGLTYMAEMYGYSGNMATTANVCTHSSRIASTEDVTYTGGVDQQPTRYNFSPNATYVLALAVFAPFSPTAVEFDRASVHTLADADGMLLRWRTGLETDNLGFRILRDDGVAGRTPIGPGLIPGSALTSPKTRLEAGYSYAWYDPDGTADSTYWIEDVERSGSTSLHGPFHADLAAEPARLGAATPPGLQLKSGAAIGRDWIQERVVSTAATHEPDQASDKAVVPSTTFGSTPAAQLTITEDGWYRVTANDLRSAGVPLTSSASHYLQLWVDGTEVAILVDDHGDGSFDPGDSIEFFGEGGETTYAPGRVYWLLDGTTPGKRIHVESLPQLTRGALTSFPETIERKERVTHIMGLLNGDRENFFGRLVMTQPVDQTLTAQRPTEKSATTLEVALQGLSYEPHQVLVAINGIQIGSVDFDADDYLVETFAVPHGLLSDGANTVTISPAIPGEGVSLIDTIRLSYSRWTLTDDDALDITVSAFRRAFSKRPISLDGFSSSDIRLVDVSNPANPIFFKSHPMATANGYALNLQNLSPSVGRAPSVSRLLAVSAPAFKAPAAISINTPTTWASEKNRADLVILGSPETLAGMETLAAHRRSQGLMVSMVNVQDVYDEFGYGSKDPAAIRDFITTAATTWAHTPKYVLLAGDGSYDPRDYIGFGQDIVPTKLLELGDFEAASDEWFTADLEPGDVVIGRLPVLSTADAAVASAKIIGYDASGVAMNDTLFIADAAVGANFQLVNQSFVDALPPTVTSEQIAVLPGDEAAARTAVQTRLNEGVPFIQYSGHGSIDLWNANMLTSEDAPALTNIDRLGFFTVMSCLNGMFHEPLLDGLGEALVKSPAGAIAVWASTSKQDTTEQEPMMRALQAALFSDPSIATLGDAVGQALTAVSPARRQGWVLIGDPSTPISR